jgi:hypothetical protein
LQLLSNRDEPLWIEGARSFDGVWSRLNGSTLETSLISDLRAPGNSWMPEDGAPENATGCAKLLSTGLIMTSYNVSCTKEKRALCSYRSCLTIQGEPCIFPFAYKNVSIIGIETELTYTECSSEDLHRPWCPTGTISKGPHSVESSLWFEGPLFQLDGLCDWS